MNTVIVASVTLISFTLTLHFLALRGISACLPQCAVCKPHIVLFAVAAIFVVHLAEIGAYAFAYTWLSNHFEVGELVGKETATYMDFYYYSAVTYTSLGIGDVFPLRHLRIISGLETLNGLLLIGWSTSFSFLLMKNYWFPRQ